jgi:hypothetical protein
MDLRRAGTLLLMAALEIPEAQARRMAGELLDRPQTAGAQQPAPPKRDAQARARLEAIRQVVDLFAGSAEPSPLSLATVRGRCGAFIGRGARSEESGALYQGDKVQVWHVAGDWSFVSETDGGRSVAGWVLSEYLRLEASRDPDA